MNQSFILDFSERGYIGTIEDIDASLKSLGFSRDSQIKGEPRADVSSKHPYSAVYSLTENRTEYAIFDETTPTAHIFASSDEKNGEIGVLHLFNINEALKGRLSGVLRGAVPHKGNSLDE